MDGIETCSTFMGLQRSEPLTVSHQARHYRKHHMSAVALPHPCPAHPPCTTSGPAGALHAVLHRAPGRAAGVHADGHQQGEAGVGAAVGRAGQALPQTHLDPGYPRGHPELYAYRCSTHATQLLISGIGIARADHCALWFRSTRRCLAVDLPLAACTPQVATEQPACGDDVPFGGGHQHWRYLKGDTAV